MHVNTILHAFSVSYTQGRCIDQCSVHGTHAEYVAHVVSV